MIFSRIAVKFPPSFTQNAKPASLDIASSSECQGTQIFEDVPADQKEEDAVWRPVPHVSAKKHTTGEATYLDDIPTMNSMCKVLVVHVKIPRKIIH